MFLPGVVAPEDTDSAKLWMLVQRDRVLFREADAGLAGNENAAGFARTGAEHFIGTLDGKQVWTAGVEDDAEAEEEWRFCDLFSVYGMADEEIWMAAGPGRADHRVGAHESLLRTLRRPHRTAPGRARVRCPQCRLLKFPQLSPAIITLVHRGDEVLLARSHRFPEGMYSALAGFVEPGETVEGALIREVEEEVGIRVTNLGVPGQPAVALPQLAHARLLRGVRERRHRAGGGGDRSSGVVPVDALPNVPGSISIANRLITSWVARHSGAEAMRYGGAAADRRRGPRHRTRRDRPGRRVRAGERA